MSLTTFQAALYFVPQPDLKAFLRQLQKAVETVDRKMGIQLRPEEEIDKEILSGDLEKFDENGDQLFLAYDAGKLDSPENEGLLHLQFINDYPGATALLLAPTLTEPTKELTNAVWNGLLAIVKGLVTEMEPLIAQINGVDDEGGSQIISAKTVAPRKLPQFFTPYTYLDRSIGAKVVEKLSDAGAYSIEKTKAGWSIQFVKDFYSSPPKELVRTLSEVLGSRRSAYKQTKVEE